MIANEGEGCTWFRAIMTWQLAREFIAVNQENAGVVHVQFWQMSFQRFFFRQAQDAMNHNALFNATAQCKGRLYSRKIQVPLWHGTPGKASRFGSKFDCTIYSSCTIQLKTSGSNDLHILQKAGAPITMNSIEFQAPRVDSPTVASQTSLYGRFHRCNVLAGMAHLLAYATLHPPKAAAARVRRRRVRAATATPPPQMSFQRILAQTEQTHCSWD
eukprot:4088426-Amphidinium_carterae.1